MREVLFDLVGDQLSLGFVAVLKESLKQTASVVLVNEVGVFVIDLLDGLIDKFVLLLVGDFFLFHHQLVVVDAKQFDQVRHFLLLTTGNLNGSFWRVLFDNLEVPSFSDDSF